MQRKHLGDRVYLNQQDKYKAIVEDIKLRRKTGQPILVGTCSVESYEHLSALLTTENITHNVLNAKHHQKEAEIIAQAGCKGALTISTNMAGRGTDIILGGNIDFQLKDLGDNPTQAQIDELKTKWQNEHQEVIDLGGLHVLGAERNESRRVDNQLIGRAGRQGDPGSSQFFLALDDPLLRIFAGDKMQGMMKYLGMKQGETIEAPMLTRAIENAQKKVEGHHFDIRKELLKYDDIANEQRTLIYQQRSELMQSESIWDVIEDMAESVAQKLQETHAPRETDSLSWDLETLTQKLQKTLS